jgi:drug/metabolite transporter (DMT)-like permease
MLATHGDIHSLAISALSLFTGLLSASAVALYSIFPANLMKKHGTLIITGWGLLLGGLMLTPAAKPWHLTGQIDTGCILMFTFLVLAGTVSTFALYMYSLPLIGAVKASVICLLEPVVATFVTVTVFHTAFTISDYIGILTILTGVLVLTLTPESTLK